MANTKVDNIKIAKNTLYMYIRMLVTMVVSLFTARINFQALGIDNFGIYNVVGSVIVFFAFINQGLTTATRRYITAEIVQGTPESQRNVFNLAFEAHIFIALIILILAETIGLWAVNSLLNIPDNRMFAANIVYQLSVFTAIVSVMQTPYTAAITANEKMNIYAYLSIYDILLKLAIAFGVLYITGDKLIIFAVLLCIGTTSVMFVNSLYCRHSFPMCRFVRPRNKSLLKEIFSYMGWNLGSQLMVILTNQGVTILVNMFFTVAANAAMGVSNQITNIVNNFVTNFQVAFNPQITKQYASKNWKDLNDLAIRSSRFSSFLVLIFMVPICCQIKNFLGIWLGNYPEGAVEFCILTLLGIFLDGISAPLWMILCSDKDVKKYQIVISLIYSFNFIGAWILLKCGFPPYSVIVARILVYAIAIIARLWLVKERVPSFPVLKWIKEVLLKSMVVSIVPIVLYVLIQKLIFDNPFLEIILVGGGVFVMMIVSIMMFGLDNKERKFLFEKIKIKCN